MDISGSTPQPDPPQPAQAPAVPSPAEPVGSPDAGGTPPSGSGVVEHPDADSGGGSANLGVESGPSHLFRYLAIYTALRLALIALLTAVLTFFMPLIVALLFAIIAQLPLAWLLFAGPRRRVNDAVAQATATRRAERARLQSALTGDADPA